MHVLFLGCGQDHVASHIIVWLETGLLKQLEEPMAPVNPPSPDNFLLLLWIHYKKRVKSEGYGSASGISFSLSSLGRSPDAPKKGYPVLSSKFKAAVVKILIIFVAVQSQQLENASDLISKVRVTNSWALAEFVHVLSGAVFWLTARERQRCMHACSL